MKKNAVGFAEGKFPHLTGVIQPHTHCAIVEFTESLLPEDHMITCKMKSETVCDTLSGIKL